MLSRCKACGLEVARGCLPTASCGCYLLLLPVLSVGCLLAAVEGLRFLLGLPVLPQGELPPWWYWSISVPFSLILLFLGTVALKRAFELIEYLAISCRPC